MPEWSSASWLVRKRAEKRVRAHDGCDDDGEYHHDEEEGGGEDAVLLGHCFELAEGSHEEERAADGAEVAEGVKHAEHGQIDTADEREGGIVSRHGREDGQAREKREERHV